jgi:uncharacterized metal-binding protein YceD (DUF177 family)
MKLFLRDFETFPAQSCLEAGPGQIQIDYDGVCDVKKATAELEIQQSGDEFFCQANITAVVTLECARCLVPFSADLKSRTDFIICSEATYEASARRTARGSARSARSTGTSRNAIAKTTT